MQKNEPKHAFYMVALWDGKTHQARSRNGDWQGQEHETYEDAEAEGLAWEAALKNK